MRTFSKPAIISTDKLSCKVFLKSMGLCCFVNHKIIIWSCVNLCFFCRTQSTLAGRVFSLCSHRKEECVAVNRHGNIYSRYMSLGWNPYLQPDTPTTLRKCRCFQPVLCTLPPSIIQLESRPFEVPLLRLCSAVDLSVYFLNPDLSLWQTSSSCDIITFILYTLVGNQETSNAVSGKVWGDQSDFSPH